jgi:hypothetical protein
MPLSASLGFVFGLWGDMANSDGDWGHTFLKWMKMTACLPQCGNVHQKKGVEAGRVFVLD